MQPKLKEKPAEWLKFTLSLSAALALVAGLLWRKGTVSRNGFFAALSVLIAADLLFWARPALCRPLYRLGMTIGFYVGQVVGRVLLTFFFFVVLTPLGLLLRAFGKDLLNPRQKSGSDSYWRASRPGGSLDREF